MKTMDLIHCKKFNIISLLVIGAGVLLASVFLFYFVAQAQTDADHETQIQAAIKDLSSVTGQDITSEDQARDLCNQEQYMDTCADIGKQHDLYTPAEEKQVDDFLTEVKGKILDDIKSCSDEECLIRVANELAKKIKTKNPTLATDFKLTTTLIEEKNSVVQAAKEAGVDFRDCEAMDPDTASIELLRQCAKLAKDSRVQKYIPENRRVLAEQFSDTTLVLREGLRSGKYQCGDNTLEGCGNYCLNPSAATVGSGIPEVCKQIATEVFGPDGVSQLESAHQQVGQVRDYYSKKFILTLPDGRELVGEGQIRNACDQAFSGRKLDMAKACGAFAVQNGFASQAEVDRGLKLMESFTNKGQNVNFDECLANPTACRDFIPEDERNRFDAGNQIFEIMKTEIGFDPSQCERGSVDQTIGDKCFEGSKRALAKIESLGLAAQSQEARFIIEDIKRHVSEGDDFTQKREQFKTVFSQQGGPGGCKSEAECFSYCSDPTNGPECISFGAQQGVSGFRGQEAVQRFQDYNQNIQRPGFISDEYRPYPPGGPYPGLPPGGDVIYPPGQDPRFTQPGPGYNPPPGTYPYYPPSYSGGGGGPGHGPAGPSPECFAAIQSGDFVKAKTACYVPSPSQPFPSGQVCPASPYVQCPAGEYRESYRNNDGCWVDGPCKPAPSYTTYPTYTPYQGDANSCPGFSYSRWDKNGKRYCQLNETRSCQYNYPSYLERGNYAPSNCPAEDDNVYPTYSSYPTGSYQPCPAGQWWDYSRNACVSSTTTYTPTPACPSGQWWDYAYNQCTSAPSCGTGYYWDEATKVCKPSGGTYSPYPSYSSGPGGSTCSQSLINLLGTGCHWMYSDSAGRGIYCDGPMSKSAKEGDTATIAGCSGGGATYSPYPSYSSGPGSSTCSQSLINLLGTGCHWMYSDSAGRGIYCDGPMSKSAKEGDSATTAGCSGGGATYSPYPSYSSGPGSSTCSQSLINLLGTGCHWMYSDSAGRGIYCDGPMSKSAKEGDSATTAGCSGGGATYSPYPSYSPPIGVGNCPSGYHYHGESGGFCMNDQENYGGTCYNASGTSTITCPVQVSYTPYPTSSPTSSGSCPSGSHTMYVNAGDYCMSDADLSKCGPLNSTSVSSFGSCSSYQTTTSYTPYPSCPSGQWWDSARNACSSTTYTPYPSCPSGQWWDSATSSCKSSTYTYTPSPSCPSSQYWNGSACVDNATTTYTPYSTPDQSVTCSSSGGTWNGSTCTYPTTSYTPPPYTPPPSCSSGQYWDGSACVANPTPYPTSTYSPPPTSSMYKPYMVAHCQQLGRTWNGEICRANGLFARIYENYVNDFATILKAFGL